MKKSPGLLNTKNDEIKMEKLFRKKKSQFI